MWPTNSKLTRLFLVKLVIYTNSIKRLAYFLWDRHCTYIWSIKIMNANLFTKRHCIKANRLSIFVMNQLHLITQIFFTKVDMLDCHKYQLFCAWKKKLVIICHRRRIVLTNPLPRYILLSYVVMNKAGKYRKIVNYYFKAKSLIKPKRKEIYIYKQNSIWVKCYKGTIRIGD